VAPIIVRTGQPAMAFGGYFGNEPILSVEDFAGMVKRGEVRYVLLGGRARPTAFTRWVLANAKPVDEAQWRSVSVERWRAVRLFDLKAGQSVD